MTQLGWESCLDEHVVRAVESRLTAAGRQDPPDDLERARYPFEPVLVEKLRQYEAQRSRYPALADFYPELIAAMRKQAKR